MAERLGKAFSISHQTTDAVTLAETVVARVRHPLRRRIREKFWALRDISFEIEQGSVVGLIGRNGSGKSTLLKILSRITPPTEGRAAFKGRVGSLLEVGTGFHQELTGRENIYLNGAILGMTRTEVTQAFDDIVEFSGVSQFLDTPVKRYSTGMYVRLAFAVAAHLSSDILLIDEVLAVGDAAFQKRSLGMMRGAADSGRTVVFVSHQMSAVAALCDRALVLDRGDLVFSGETSEAIERYIASYAPSPTDDVASPAAHRPGGGEWRVTGAKSTRAAYRVDEVKSLEFEARRNTREETGFYPSVHILDETGVVLLRCDSRLAGSEVGPGASAASFRVSIRTPWLRPGRFYVDILLVNYGLYDLWERAITFEVLPVLPYRFPADAGAIEGGPVLADFDFETTNGYSNHRDSSRP
jgi:lipopolysaccharide transport system ATP-binding protein